MKKILLFVFVAFFIPGGQLLADEVSRDVRPAYDIAARQDGQISNAHLNDIWGREYSYSGDLTLQVAMAGLATVDYKDSLNDAVIDDYLKDIAAVTPMSLEQVEQEWEVFKSVRENQNKPSDMLGQRGEWDEKAAALSPRLQAASDSGVVAEHMDAHWATNQQLQGGSILAENIDGISSPVFGAMLAPTMGTTGPGGEVLSWLLDDTVGHSEGIANHTTAHDAYGWLYNMLDIGPGYAYAPNAPRWEIAKTDNALSGQISGIVNALRESSCPYDRALGGIVSADPGTFLKATGEIAWNRVEASWDSLVSIGKEKISDGINWVVDTATGKISEVATATTDSVLSWLGDTVSSGANWVIDQGGSLLESAPSFFGVDGPALADAFRRESTSRVTDVIDSYSERARTELTTAIDSNLQRVGSDAATSVSDSINSAIDGASSEMKSRITDAIDYTGGTPSWGGVARGASSVYETLSSQGTTEFDSSGRSGLGMGIVQALKHFIPFLN